MKATKAKKAKIIIISHQRNESYIRVRIIIHRMQLIEKNHCPNTIYRKICFYWLKTNFLYIEWPIFHINCFENIFSINCSLISINFSINQFSINFSINSYSINLTRPKEMSRCRHYDSAQLRIKEKVLLFLFFLIFFNFFLI